MRWVDNLQNVHSGFERQEILGKLHLLKFIPSHYHEFEMESSLALLHTFREKNIIMKSLGEFVKSIQFVESE